MKKLFYLNKRWSNAFLFFAVNLLFALLALFIVAFDVNKTPWLWISITFAIFITMFWVLTTGAARTVKEIEIVNNKITLRFLFFAPKKYVFNELRYYATANFGSMRYGSYHSIILEFTDGARYQVASPIVENYKAFLEFMRSNNFEFYGYIGQNNWRRKNKALSKKWVVPRNEIELENEIEKKRGVIIFYIYGGLELAMSLAILRYLIVFH